MSNISDRVAIVTGASSGIGKATAIALARAGCKVVLAARRVERLETLKKQIVNDGGKALVVECDIAKRDDVKKLINATLDTFGTIDILINNAGVMPVSPIELDRYQDWDNMVDINIKGLLYGIGLSLPTMIEKGRGHIINVSSVAGRNVFPGNTVYCATKHAVHVISDGLRAELAQHDPPRKGIRVTTIAPGVVDTELPDSTTNEDKKEEIKSYYDSVKDPLTSEDIANSILYAVQSPPHVNVNEILIRPIAQTR